jgi:putative ABC transport system permease protein
MRHSFSRYIATGLTIAISSAFISATFVLSRAMEQKTASSLQGSSSGSMMLRYIMLAFALIAVAVAALVISNTFQVLVARRRQTFALLRCAGAYKRQVFTSVAFEATLLATVTSIIGALGGYLLILVLQATVLVLKNSIHAPTLTFEDVLVPLIVSIIATFLASILPAKVASKISPVEALRANDETGDKVSSISKKRFITGLILFVVGTIWLIMTVVDISNFNYETASAQDASSVFVGAFFQAFTAGFATFVGVIMLAPFWTKIFLSLLSLLFAHISPASNLAFANTRQNGRRTSATISALVIGVTLISLFSAGATSAKVTLGNEVGNRNALDFAVTAMTPNAENDAKLTTALSATKAMSEVERAELVKSAVVAVGRTPTDHFAELSIMPMSPEIAHKFLRADPALYAVKDGEILLPNSVGSRIGESEKAVYATNNASIDHAIEDAKFPNCVSNRECTMLVPKFLASQYSNTSSAYVSPATFNEIVKRGLITTSTSTMWVKVKDSANPQDTFVKLMGEFEKMSVNQQNFAIEGGIMVRGIMNSIIDTLLVFAVAMLGIGVVIAYIGIANTLSLSVIERKRELALLRAVGMQKSSIRASITIEALLTAVIGALVGVVQGTLFGFAGASIILGFMMHVTYAVDYAHIALAVLVSIAAAVLASILPARMALKTQPAEALKAE